jgi:hypothetical protein
MRRPGWTGISQMANAPPVWSLVILMMMSRPPSQTRSPSSREILCGQFDAEFGAGSTHLARQAGASNGAAQ